MSDAPPLPPDYSTSSPQILVAPLPESPSFFQANTITGEIYVKGLGDHSTGSNNVHQLSVTLNVVSLLEPNAPIRIYESSPQTLYPPRSSSSSLSTSFPTTHKFTIPLPTQQLPSTLSLSPKYGSITYTLPVTLTLSSGQTISETINIEGTPYDSSTSDHESQPASEVEKHLDRNGMRCRVLLDNPEPRLGGLLRLGLEIRPTPHEKRRSQLDTPITGSSLTSNSNTSEATRALRQLRRVRVELFRQVIISNPHQNPNTSTTPSADLRNLRLIYTSGKSLRYPGASTHHPPLRVLFTLPTQSSVLTDGSWGEITHKAGYHDVRFFVRVSVGFGAGGNSGNGGGSSGEGSTGVNGGVGDGGDWIIEVPLKILPKRWIQPFTTPNIPSTAHSSDSAQDVSVSYPGISQDHLNEDTAAREAYRRKGPDVVGSGGTYRDEGAGSSTRYAIDAGEDLLPPFEGASGSGSGDGGLPSFLESEREVRARRTGSAGLGADDRVNIVGRRGSLGGELGSWVEYDGYETFSSPPPSLSASFGVGGIMDPPQPGEDEAEADGLEVVGGMVARLGLGDAGGNRGGLGRTRGRELIERLGLGEGSRVVDLHDDLPPGIDEPSLPALPDFSSHPHPHSHNHPPVFSAASEHPPPSFAASEAAHTGSTGGVARLHPHGEMEGEAPPGYFGDSVSPGAGAGPPAYS